MGWGDELMVTGHVRELQISDPRKVRIIYEKRRYHESWYCNPRIAALDEKGDFQEFTPRPNGLRPYCTAKSMERWTWKAYGPPVGELYFKDEEMKTGDKYASRVIVEPYLKPGASPNKQWGRDRWSALSLMLKQAGFTVCQIGAAQPALVLPGAEFVCTRSMRLAAAVVARAKAVIVPEGGLHHVAAALKTPAVVIFGGYIAPSVTGYSHQKNLFVDSPEHPLGCGWRVKCDHCTAAMESITPREVMARFLEVMR